MKRHKQLGRREYKKKIQDIIRDKNLIFWSDEKKNFENRLNPEVYEKISKNELERTTVRHNIKNHIRD